jgi:hypothetical protein
LASLRRPGGPCALEKKPPPGRRESPSPQRTKTVRMPNEPTCSRLGLDQTVRLMECSRRRPRDRTRGYLGLIPAAQWTKRSPPGTTPRRRRQPRPLALPSRSLSPLAITPSRGSVEQATGCDAGA